MDVLCIIKTSAGLYAGVGRSLREQSTTTAKITQTRSPSNKASIGNTIGNSIGNSIKKICRNNGWIMYIKNIILT